MQLSSQVKGFWFAPRSWQIKQEKAWADGSAIYINMRCLENNLLDVGLHLIKIVDH